MREALPARQARPRPEQRLLAASLLAALLVTIGGLLFAHVDSRVPLCCRNGCCCAPRSGSGVCLRPLCCCGLDEVVPVLLSAKPAVLPVSGSLPLPGLWARLAPRETAGPADPGAAPPKPPPRILVVT
jgi:hypothetical protein